MRYQRAEGITSSTSGIAFYDEQRIDGTSSGRLFYSLFLFV